MNNMIDTRDYHWFEATILNANEKYRISCLVKALSTRQIRSFFDLELGELLIVNPMSKSQVIDRLTKSGKINKMDDMAIAELNDSKHYLK